jgi:uncharacterized protein YkwD
MTEFSAVKDPAVRTSRAALLALPTALLSALVLTASLLAPPAASAATTRESRMLAKINSARAQHGMGALRVNASLTRYARKHARQMGARGGLFHTQNFRVICCWSRIGENVGYDRTVWRMHRAFMHSPGHRANILNPAFRQAGIGIVKIDGVLWVTEVFRRPA